MSIHEQMLSVLEAVQPGARRLYEVGAISRRSLRRSVVGIEFNRLFVSTKRTARDIELELSAMYDVPLKTVQEIRRTYMRNKTK